MRGCMRSLRLCLFVIVAVICACASAQAQVLLEEGKVRVNVVADENIDGKLTVHNTSDAQISLKVYWEDFVYKAPFDGSKNFLPKGTSDYSLASWVNVPTQTLQVPPFSKRNVPYLINVPEDIAQGHYGVLFFEKTMSEETPSKGMNIISRAGCLFFVEPKNKAKRIELDNFRFAEKGLTADFTSRGNVIIIPDGTFYIIDEGGMVFDRGEIKKIYLPPGETADYTLAFNDGLASGTYTLVMTLDLDDGDVAVREIDFTKSGSSDHKVLTVRE
jgi:hypothetical protein